MKQLGLFLVTALPLICFAQEGATCKKCEKVREYHAAHTENNYEWYDDYLKDKAEGKAKEANLNQDSEN